MGVYVGKNEYRYGRMIMSHMAADTIKELHSMAYAIGVHVRHFQDKKGKPHYDVSKAMKQRAIQFGAIEVNDREIIKLFKQTNHA